MLIKRSLALALAIMSMVQLGECVASGQTRRRPSTPTTRTATRVQKRRVILDLQGQDAPVSADLIEANAASVTVEINGVRRVYKADDVIGIIYSPNEAERKYPQTAREPESAPTPTPNLKDLVKVKYDEAKDQTMVYTDFLNVYQDDHQGIAIGAVAIFKGRTPPANPELHIAFRSLADNWQYDSYYNDIGFPRFKNTLRILVDGSPLTRLGNDVTTIRQASTENGQARETISATLYYREFAALAKAQRVDVQLLQQRFQISAASLEMLREFLRSATAGQ